MVSDIGRRKGDVWCGKGQSGGVWTGWEEWLGRAWGWVGAGVGTPFPFFRDQDVAGLYGGAWGKLGAGCRLGQIEWFE